MMMSMKSVLEEHGEGSPLLVNRLQAAWMKFLTVLEQTVMLEMVFPCMSKEGVACKEVVLGCWNG